MSESGVYDLILWFRDPHILRSSLRARSWGATAAVALFVSVVLGAPYQFTPPEWIGRSLACSHRMSTQRTSAGQAAPSPAPPTSALAAKDAAAPANQTPDATAAPEEAATVAAATQAADAVQDEAPAVNSAAAAAAAGAGAGTYGAAEASLVDPACRPGTAEFATAKASNGQLLSQYRATHDSYKDGGVSEANVLLLLLLFLMLCSSSALLCTNRCRSASFTLYPAPQ